MFLSTNERLVLRHYTGVNQTPVTYDIPAVVTLLVSTGIADLMSESSLLLAVHSS